MAAQLRIRWLAAWRIITKWQVFTGGAWHEVQRARVFKTVNKLQGWHDFYIKGGTAPPPSPPPSPPPPPPPPSVTLSVTASPSSISGTRVGAGSVTTNIASVSVSRGTAPYTYRFTRSTYSGDVVPTIEVIAGHPEQARMTRNMTGTAPETQTARLRCRVTDSQGNSGTCFIDVTFLTTTQSGTGDGGGGDGDPVLCVAVDSYIMMADETVKRADEVKKGDKIKAPDAETGVWGIHTVTDHLIAHGQPLVRVEVGNKVLRGTPEHRIKIGNDWVHLRDIGTPDGVGSVVKMSTTSKTYVSNGLVSHNVKPRS